MVDEDMSMVWFGLKGNMKTESGIVLRTYREDTHLEGIRSYGPIMITGAQVGRSLVSVLSGLQAVISCWAIER